MLVLTPLEQAIGHLAQGLARASADPGDELLRDGVIQRFEYTYELSHKMLKRYLEMTEASSEPLDDLPFQGVIRLGSERGLLQNGWDVWRGYRAARGTTSHAYDAVKATDGLRADPGVSGGSRVPARTTAAAAGCLVSLALDIAADHEVLVRDVLDTCAPRPSYVWAFGSRAKGRAKPFSGLDLAIDAGRPLTFDDLGRLQTAFEDSALPWRVDVIDLMTVSADFRAAIEADAKLFVRL